MRQNKWILKGCPRCKGDIYIEIVNGEQEKVCIQCGYRKRPEPLKLHKPEAESWRMRKVNAK